MKKLIILTLCLLTATLFALPAGATTLNPGQTQKLVDVSSLDSDVAGRFFFNGTNALTLADGMIHVSTDMPSSWVSFAKASVGVSLVDWEYFGFRVKNNTASPVKLNVLLWSNGAFFTDYLLLDTNYAYLSSSSGYITEIPANFDGWFFASNSAFTYQGGGSFCRTGGDTTVFSNPNEGMFFGVQYDPTNIEQISFSFPEQSAFDLSFGDMMLLNLAGTDPTAEPSSEPTDAPTDAPTVAPSVVPTDAPTDAPTESPAEVPFIAELRNAEYVIIGILAVAVILTVLVLVKKEK